MTLSTSTVNDPHFQMYLEKNFLGYRKLENYFKNKNNLQKTKFIMFIQPMSWFYVLVICVILTTIHLEVTIVPIWSYFIFTLTRKLISIAFFFPRYLMNVDLFHMKLVA